MNYKIKSYYGAREHPITHKITGHKGLDTVTYGSDKNVHVMADGKVLHVANQTKIVKNKEGNDVKTGWGNVIFVKHTTDDGSQYISRYAHLEGLPKFKKGDSLKEGQVIGVMGSTGGATGPHLHTELLKYNNNNKVFENIDPYKNSSGGIVNIGKYNKLSDIQK